MYMTLLYLQYLKFYTILNLHEQNCPHEMYYYAQTVPTRMQPDFTRMAALRDG